MIENTQKELQIAVNEYSIFYKIKNFYIEENYKQILNKNSLAKYLNVSC